MPFSRILKLTLQKDFFREIIFKKCAKNQYAFWIYNEVDKFAVENSEEFDDVWLLRHRFGLDCLSVEAETPFLAVKFSFFAAF